MQLRQNAALLPFPASPSSTSLLLLHLLRLRQASLQHANKSCALFLSAYTRPTTGAALHAHERASNTRQSFGNAETRVCDEGGCQSWCVSWICTLVNRRRKAASRPDHAAGTHAMLLSSSTNKAGAVSSELTVMHARIDLERPTTCPLRLC